MNSLVCLKYFGTLIIDMQKNRVTAENTHSNSQELLVLNKLSLQHQKLHQLHVHNINSAVEPLTLALRLLCAHIKNIKIPLKKRQKSHCVFPRVKQLLDMRILWLRVQSNLKHRYYCKQKVLCRCSRDPFRFRQGEQQNKTL